MSEERWISLTPEEFDQLQKYSEYSSKKIKDVLAEFNEGGSLKQYDPHKPISYDVFRLFMRSYLEVDLPQPLSTHLFLAFSQKPRQETPDHPKDEASSSEPNGPDSNIQNADNAVKADEACAPDAESKMAEKRTPARSQVAAAFLGGPAAEYAGSEPPVVYLKDVVCYLSLLETGRPQDKLEFMFRLYDVDENGLLDQAEMDRIVNQMLHIAQYLEWDPTELRPILKEMLQGMDYDRDGFVSLQEWVHGGMTTIPLLVLLGMDETGCTGDGRHAWTLKHFKKPTYCNFCHIMLMGVRKQGLCCTYCKYTVHERCVSKNIPACVKTCSKAKRSGEVGDTYCLVLLHAASGTTCPSPWIPRQEGAWELSPVPSVPGGRPLNHPVHPSICSASRRPSCARHCTRGPQVIRDGPCCPNALPSSGRHRSVSRAQSSEMPAVMIGLCRTELRHRGETTASFTKKVAFELSLEPHQKDFMWQQGGQGTPGRRFPGL